SLADHTHDLGVSKAITLHQNLLNSYAEKILIQKSLFLWGDYPLLYRDWDSACALLWFLFCRQVSQREPHLLVSKKKPQTWVPR
ncbi:MAG: hypothetical protein LIV27_06105, partial [Acetobacter sp.]|nr:hypothetical protein [Acetobacter sp.]